eukprot:TRINITY_DN10448_c0_g1_i2.p1 TRINITY_DN10448_c0_g1~~TRINITY_DN10448_c0_g1_i2.p1  ORF type:complete len:379 (+),score=121.96 TRINITY_DN10448_c0_g1_i2:216-1352(+)
MDEEMFDVGRGEALSFSQQSKPGVQDNRMFETDMLSPEVLRDAHDPASGLRMDMMPEDFEPGFDESMAGLEMEGRTPVSESVRSASYTHEGHEEYGTGMEMDYGVQDVGKVLFKGKRGNTVLVDERTTIPTSEIREMLKNTSEIVNEPEKSTPRRKKRQRVAVLPTLREPMVPDFPQAVCSMILSKMTSSTQAAATERARDAVTPMRAPADHFPSNGTTPMANLMEDPTGLHSGDNAFMDAEQDFTEFQAAAADDFDIPVATRESSGLGTYDSMRSTPLYETANDEEDEDSESKDGFTSRTRAVLSSLQTNFESKQELSLKTFVGAQLSKNKASQKRVAAQTFYEMLVLRSRDLLSLEQDAPYSDISIAPTEQLAGFQ